MKFATRTEVISYLVGEGKPLNFAKVAVDQGYNYEADDDTRDLCFRGHEEEDFDFNPVATAWDMTEDQRPTFVTPEDAIAMYNTFEEMISVEGNNIAIDGEVMYSIEGNLLPMDASYHFIPN